MLRLEPLPQRAAGLSRVVAPVSDITTIDLIRHGQPQGGKKYRGWIDDPLSDVGWAQMRAAVATEQPWDAIITSPLRRCHAFATELGAHMGFAVATDERLKEVGFGSWEGQTGEQIRASDPTALRRFYRDPVEARPDGAEPLADFQQRVTEALQDVQRQYAGRHVLLVTHAGVIRAAIAYTLIAPLATIYRINVDNAAFTRLRSSSERPLSLISHGLTSFYP